LNTKPIDREKESVPLPPGYGLCIELTRGFERAAPECYGSTPEWAISKAWPLTALVSLVGLTLAVASGWLYSDAHEDLSLLGLTLIILVPGSFGLGLYLRIVRYHRRMTSLLNSIYYRADNLIDPYRTDGERVLLTLFTELPGLFGTRSLIPSGLLVFTTHRCFFFTTSVGYNIVSAVSRPAVCGIEVCDYSYAPDFLHLGETRRLTVPLVSRKFRMKTHISPEPETWEVMPIDGNNFNLLDAILERRDTPKCFDFRERVESRA